MNTHTKPRCYPALLASVFLLSFFAPWPCSLAATLLGIDTDTGNLYQISTADASLSLIGNTGIPVPAELQFAPDGSLYCFTVGTNSVLYTIDPNSAQATLIGPLGVGLVFEGGLAFSPAGVAYGANAGTAVVPQLFRLDLSTGHATIIGTISGGLHDINGLAWRSDGMLVGLDRESNSLLAINPQTAVSSTIAALSPVVGAVGGMTALGDTGYFSTSGLGGYFPGSDGLYSFNLMTGAYNFIGSFSPAIQGTGISGIALMPQSSPKLTISSVSTTSVQISWATNFSGYTLKYAAALRGATWTSDTNAVVLKGAFFTVTCNRAATPRFYRLSNP